ncbi:glycine dehydrogenase [Thermotoga maritima MSB8]|uniref:Probable glycine dehydrogenase (decarboxylating) subunit 2 n=1 Tax=Thermotoga maritima (strain ATCC 43589 / DSM 3109 / JCM 10099 / NBRC 100826 / MSB8) TaxID=243274 RepID=GCSPB_THEMA|nr:aminomethyl-transferring glycine dehydrogenase subunit GcvPB [Thermotoga maritima]Q9WY57.1 RecName: Full=Probable glycine dehydrogenase (decarboxylating) subunit 2; AltName: Full=Glycine cleavage system P-protein subunit 2; AltName: Full=Glycine decarboxylase subunit 2; AltName: Full=Glycine dehydrogenase (aminomethyl-transferring) subunit 2 [Thermotoga maritima MSB8]AAD35306.1 glycine dehydrogenase (decarboxylating) subunit 2 [Thermotoga maritima MSB8]AGL49138.1 Glycine dehydrogenase [decarb
MTIFERSKKGRKAFRLPESDIPEYSLPDRFLRRTPPELPEVSEPDLVRHYTNLARKNYSVDLGIYPLGSCTMKYNPKLNEKAANLEGFREIHPYQPVETVQGSLRLMYELKKMLCEITGMDDMTLQPAAGAHGELTGMLIVREYFKNRGDTGRKKVLVPDSAHGTNPASASMVGFEVVEIKSKNGMVDVEDLKKLLDEEVAAVMLTNPNTLGLFEKDILKIAEMTHECGALLYYDGANLNAIMGKVRPGDMGFDIVHLNLHKTFSTPHGMGGPGSGPVGVKKHLVDFLPFPQVKKNGELYELFVPEKTIGRVRSFFGNFPVLVKAYTYILTMGRDGLERVSEMAVLNANYLKKKIEKFLEIPYNGFCMHEFVASAEKVFRETGVRTLDIAKRILDFGVHPPTVYFPLIVPEALMIEPTETENKETLDKYAEILERVVKEAYENPDALKNAPHNTPVRRVNEVLASKKPVFRWRG